LDDDYGLNFDASIMHGARLTIQAPTENDFLEKASLILERTTVMGFVLVMGSAAGFGGGLDKPILLHARLLDRQPNSLVDILGISPCGDGEQIVTTIIDGTDVVAENNPVMGIEAGASTVGGWAQ
jgi:hypothetical protein